MKIDIILAGVGGQGIVSIAATIGMAALKSNLNLKQSEVHGMSQRGGEVQSHMRISDGVIASDLVSQGKADLIISVEPMESLRYLPWLSKDGWLITNTTPFVNIPNYPPIDKVLDEVKKLKNHILVDADAIAKELNSPKSANMVILGAASKHLSIPFEKLEEAIRSMFGRKGEEIVNINLKALKAGRDAS